MKSIFTSEQMKSKTETYLLVFSLIITQSVSWGQNTIVADTINLADGKWTVCTETIFSVDYKCTNGWTNYTFDEKGSFVENQENRKWNGKYELNGASLSIKRNDETTGKCAVKYGKNIYTIIWLDKNRFYATGQEGPDGPTVYTYFERIK
jgi:hypothetical protein